MKSTDKILDRFERDIHKLETESVKVAVRHDAKPTARTFRHLHALKLQVFGLEQEFRAVFGVIATK